MHFCPGTITTHAESINSDLQRGLDNRLRHIQHIDSEVFANSNPRSTEPAGLEPAPLTNLSKYVRRP